MNTRSTDKDADSLVKRSKFRLFTKEYRFALLAMACVLMIVISHVFPRIQNSPLEVITGTANYGAILSGLMSIFIDRSPWPGILLFWIGLSSLLIVPV